MVLLTSALVLGCTTARSDRAEPSVNLTVSAAASLTEVLGAIATRFTAAHPKISVDYNFASSGALQRQIEQGAPVDVFFSAAAQQMDALAERRLILPTSRQDVVTNRLVVIAPRTSPLALSQIEQLNPDNISHFAVGEFRSVPAGQYAQQVLQNIGLLSALDNKLVFGNSVRSVLAAVSTGSADVGLVYATDAALSDRVKVLLTVPAEVHDPIVYPAAVIQASRQPEAATRFIKFLRTPSAQDTFAAFGFGPIP